MAKLKGFWSYVHADDDADSGRVSRLAHDVAAQFEMLTGEKIDLFFDRDDIDWGEDWRDKIDESLASIAFFIAVVTPRYFMSPECRRELRFFARRAKNLGIKELVLPLLYVDILSLHEDTPSDDLVALVKSFQWENWLDLRFVDLGAGEYRHGVAAADDSPGLLDRLAAAEETLPQWQTTLEATSQEILLIGRIMQEATADMERGNAQGKGFAARLAIARRIS